MHDVESSVERFVNCQISFFVQVVWFWQSVEGEAVERRLRPTYFEMLAHR